MTFLGLNGKIMEKAFLNEGLSQAKLCVGGCKALRWRLQSFALAIAKLCVRDGLNWHGNRQSYFR